MYKFVNSLNDPEPWIKHFKERAGTSTRWKAEVDHSVVILPREIKHQGVDDPTRLHTVVPVEQTTEQAKAALTRDIAENSQPSTKPATPAKKSRKKPSKPVKRKVKAITKATKDIFTQAAERQKKKKKT